MFSISGEGFRRRSVLGFGVRLGFRLGLGFLEAKGLSLGVGFGV